MSKNKPTWYILGAGAIGCLWASYWRKENFPVVLITRTARTQSSIELTQLYSAGEAIRENITVEQITIDALANSTIVIDYLLVTTKAHQTVDALVSIESKLSANAKLLVLQNGMLSATIETRFPNQQIIAAITTDGAYRTNALSVVHAGRGLSLVDCEPEFLDALPRTYLDIQACSDFKVKQWMKLAINCAINGLTVIHHCQNGKLLNKPEAKRQLQTLCSEITKVLVALGIADKNLDLFSQVEKTLRDTAENYSSMYQDIANKRRTEIDFINGFMQQQATHLGISCPMNDFILLEIRNREGNFAQ